jgi:hypothetical protein
MENKAKFGYFYNEDSWDIQLREFNRRYLKEEGKFIQIKINEEEYIRVGHLQHGIILEKTLDEFGMKFDTRENREGIYIPLERGDNYNLIGAGKIRFYGEKLNFYDKSSDYFNYVKGTNEENLEKIFGDENVTGVEGFNEPSFLVRI